MSARCRQRNRRSSSGQSQILVLQPPPLVPPRDWDAIALSIQPVARFPYPVSPHIAPRGSPNTTRGTAGLPFPTWRPIAGPLAPHAMSSALRPVFHDPYHRECDAGCCYVLQRNSKELPWQWLEETSRTLVSDTAVLWCVHTSPESLART